MPSLQGHTSLSSPDSSSWLPFSSSRLPMVTVYGLVQAPKGLFLLKPGSRQLVSSETRRQMASKPAFHIRNALELQRESAKAPVQELIRQLPYVHGPGGRKEQGLPLPRPPVSHRKRCVSLTKPAPRPDPEPLLAPLLKGKSLKSMEIPAVSSKVTVSHLWPRLGMSCRIFRICGSKPMSSMRSASSSVSFCTRPSRSWPPSQKSCKPLFYRGYISYILYTAISTMYTVLISYIELYVDVDISYSSI